MFSSFSRRVIARRAFTLIELLVVICIIALLAAILFPVFSRAREQARKSTCQSNLKQIALGFQQYQSDFDDRFPHAWDVVDGDAGVKPNSVSTSNAPTLATPTTDPNQEIPVTWPAKIEPYLKSRQIFTCPSRYTIGYNSCNAPFNAGRAAVAFGWPANVDDAGGCGNLYGCTQGASMVSYGYNYFYLGGGQAPGTYQCRAYAVPNASNVYNNGVGALDSSIADASSTVLLVDNAPANIGNSLIEGSPAFAYVNLYTASNPTNDIYGADRVGAAGCSAAGTSEVRDTIDPRHLDGLNVAFADGHVKWMKKETLLYNTGVGCSGNQTAPLSTDPKFIWNRL